MAIFVHRVKDLPAGLYLFVRDASQTRALRAAFTKVEQCQRPVECPPQLELYCLIEAEAQQSARQVSCHQDIASDGCFSLGMIAEYEAPIEQNGPWFYPRLFWEAGMIGQVLYLEAEAAGIRSTGIGCYFDDPMHRVLGLQDLVEQGRAPTLLPHHGELAWGVALLRRPFFRLFIGIFARGRFLFCSFCAGTELRTAPTRLFRAASPS